MREQRRAEPQWKAHFFREPGPRSAGGRSLALTRSDASLVRARGRWLDEKLGDTINERDFHLLVKGSRADVRYLASARGPVESRRLLSGDLPDPNHEHASELWVSPKGIVFDAWHFAFPEKDAGQPHIARVDDDQKVYDRIQHDVYNLLERMGHNPSNPTGQKAEVKFLGPDYSQTLYGGPYGYHPPEGAGH